MKRALFISKNLIGDGLNISPALEAWYEKHKDWDIDLLTVPNGAEILYSGMGVPLKVHVDEKTLAPHYDFRFNFDVGTAFQLGSFTNKHITECYAHMLGVKIKDRRPKYIATATSENKNIGEGLVLFSLFSNSCSSREGKPPNKMVPFEKMAGIIDHFGMVQTGIGLGLLGDNSAYIPRVIENATGGISGYFGYDLNTVALMLRNCRLLVTIDNGIAHLAATQKTKSIVLYPACLTQSWIAPIGNPNAVIVQIDPATISSQELEEKIFEAEKKLLPF